MSMSRAEAGRLGGMATVARHGRAHMSEIGARGFASALELGYGALLAELLRPSYRAKYGRDPVVRCGAQPDRPRSAPVAGACAWPSCTAPAAHSHHVDGWCASGEQIGLCAAHHAELHRRWRAECKRWRGRERDGGPVARPTLRQIALSVGIGASSLEGLR